MLLAFGVTDGNMENGATCADSAVHWSATPQSEDSYLNPCLLLQFGYQRQILNWLLVNVSVTDLLLKGEGA